MFAEDGAEAAAVIPATITVVAAVVAATSAAERAIESAEYVDPCALPGDRSSGDRPRADASLVHGYAGRHMRFCTAPAVLCMVVCLPSCQYDFEKSTPDPEPPLTSSHL